MSTPSLDADGLAEIEHRAFSWATTGDVRQIAGWDVPTLVAEVRSLRGVVQAATDLVRSAQGSHYFHGWDPGIVSVRDLAAALGIEPNGPPPPPTEAELQEMRAMLAEVRSDRAALAAAADAPQPETATLLDEIGGDECGDLLPGDENLPLAANVDPVTEADREARIDREARQR